VNRFVEVSGHPRETWPRWWSRSRGINVLATSPALFIALLNYGLLVDVVVLILLLGRARKRELAPAGAFPNSVQHILVDTSIGEA
jgi:hypothetical protein